MQPLWEQVTIVGVGLIGGSLGMALRKKGLAKSVIGVDVREKILDTAVEMEAIDRGIVDLQAGVAEADLVVLATPICTSVRILTEIAPFLKKGCVVTDVGSTKNLIVETAARIMPEGTVFVGGHPMAGSEQAGVNGADLYLFENAVHILTVMPGTPEEPVQKLKQTVNSIGARVLEMNPVQHDFLVAGISHLPHIVAAALVNTVGRLHKDYPDILGLAAGGFRDTTRIASGHPLMWRDICTTNKEQILEVLKIFKETLNEMEAMIDNCDEEGIEAEFNRAREIRRGIPARMKGYLPVLYEIIIYVPDRPGVIAGIASLLGEAGINISDIEIMRVKEGEGGSIRLGFGSAEDQEKALTLFRENNIKAKIKL
ncbi:prephenate dehydrogenase [Thermincola ferriacetica]|uniref:Prephenate dehydrogenase n=1 Tax=Thermincola ferriacetica TaxID=281456 RepID=A0A0L6VYE2_9FIRM|nr:prephenate dehydrogenase [Thermincola ferriacetica]KNZ68347.1 prephenate dehydrogenase [Thermincola ferriacetica]